MPLPCSRGSCQGVLKPCLSPIQGWRLSERALRDAPPSALRTCCSTPSRSPSSLPGRPLFCCLFGEGLPHFSPGLVPSTAGHCGWDEGAGVQSLMLHCPLVPGWLPEQGGFPTCTFLPGLCTLGVWLELQLGPLNVSVNTPLPRWGFVQQRRGEKPGGERILSLLVTQTFQELVGRSLSFGRVGPPG